MHITQYHLSLLSLWWVCACSQLSHAAVHWYENKKTKCLNPPRTARRVETVIVQCQEEVKNKLVQEALQILREEMAQSERDANIFPTDLMPPLAEPAPSALAWSNNEEQTQVGDADAMDYYDDNDNDNEEATDDQEEQIEAIAEQYYATTEAIVSHFLPTVAPAQRRRRRRRRTPRLSHRSDRIYTPTLVPLEDKRIAGCLLHCVYAKNNAIDALGWPTLDGLVNFYSEGVSEHGFFMATLRSVNRCLRAVTKKYNIDRRVQPQRGESCDLAFDVFDCIADQITGYCLDQFV